jgi:hypothetical protein
MHMLTYIRCKVIIKGKCGWESRYKEGGKEGRNKCIIGILFFLVGFLLGSIFIFLYTPSSSFVRIHVT